MCRLAIILALLATLVTGACVVTADGLAAGPEMTDEAGVQPPKDEPGFTAYVAGLLARSLDSGAEVFVKDPLTLGVRRGTGYPEIQANLDRIWHTCASDPARCVLVVEEYVAGVSAMAREGPSRIDTAALRAVVRTSEYLDEVRGSYTGSPVAAPIAKPLAGDLWLVCVVDREQTAKLLIVDDLEELGLTEHAAIDLCERNTVAALPPLRTVAEITLDATHSYVLRDYYTSGWLLRQQDWAEMARETRGRLIAAVPDSDLIVYGDSAHPGAIDSMQTTIRIAMEAANRPVSPKLLEWTADGWRLFVTESSPD